MTAPLWTIADIAQAVGGDITASPETVVSGVSIDTRTLQPGDLFVALQGENQDGHKFVEKAFEAGAAAAFVTPDYASDRNGLIRVSDTLRAMEDLGRQARARTDARVVAVTGSVGKTGTKEMLRLALSACGQTHAAEKSYNNHWGVPLTLARMPAESTFLVAELGMNHPGEITPLSQMVRPHVAVVTAIAPVHIGYLGSLEAIARAKAEIFDGLEPGGIAVLNANAPHLDVLQDAARAQGAEVRLFGNGDAGSMAEEVRLVEGMQHVKARINGTPVAFTLHARGDHHVTNAIAALTACDALQADLDKASAALSEFCAQPGRGALETIDTGDGPITLLDESYNANPASVAAALSVLASTGPAGARRIAVLGDMLELGALGPELHLGLAEPLEKAGVDLLFACGPLMAELHAALPASQSGAWAETSLELLEPLIGTLRAGDILMVKGSLGSCMGPLVAALRSHFDGNRTPR